MIVITQDYTLQRVHIVNNSFLSALKHGKKASFAVICNANPKRFAQTINL